MVWVWSKYQCKDTYLFIKKKLFSSFAHITIVTKSSNMKINPKIHITKHVRKVKNNIYKNLTIGPFIMLHKSIEFGIIRQNSQHYRGVFGMGS